MAGGYVGNCQTFPINHGTDLEGRGSFCSFVSKVCGRDERWNYFKGRIIYKHQDNRKIIVKALREPDQLLSQRECQAEVQKLLLAKKVVEQNPDLRVQVFSTYYSDIDEVSTSCGGSSRELVEGTRVLIQERTKERIEDYRPLSGDNQFGREPYPHPHLLQFVRAVFTSSNGRYVVSGLQGFKKGDADSLTYFVTSLTVHSVTQEFGMTDKGAEGVKVYVNCTGLQNIPRPLSETCISPQASAEPQTSPQPLRLSASAPLMEETDQIGLTTVERVPRGDHPFFTCGSDVPLETPPPAYHELNWQHQRNDIEGNHILTPPPAYAGENHT